MMGTGNSQRAFFYNLSEPFVPADHPLRAIRPLIDRSSRPEEREIDDNDVERQRRSANRPSAAALIISVVPATRRKRSHIVAFGGEIARSYQRRPRRRLASLT